MRHFTPADIRAAHRAAAVEKGSTDCNSPRLDYIYVGGACDDGVSALSIEQGRSEQYYGPSLDQSPSLLDGLDENDEEAEDNDSLWSQTAGRSNKSKTSFRVSAKRKKGATNFTRKKKRQKKASAESLRVSQSGSSSDPTPDVEQPPRIENYDTKDYKTQGYHEDSESRPQSPAPVPIDNGYIHEGHQVDTQAQQGLKHGAVDEDVEALVDDTVSVSMVLDDAWTPMQSREEHFQYHPENDEADKQPPGSPQLTPFGGEREGSKDPSAERDRAEPGAGSRGSDDRGNHKDEDDSNGDAAQHFQDAVNHNSSIIDDSSAVNREYPYQRQVTEHGSGALHSLASHSGPEPDRGSVGLSQNTKKEQVALSPLRLSDTSLERIEGGHMLDDGVMEWALRIFLSVSPYTRLGDSRKLAQVAHRDDLDDCWRDLFIYEPRPVQDVTLFSACNFDNIHWVLTVASVSGPSDSPAVDVWSLDSLGSKEYKAKAHAMTKKWMQAIIPPETAEALAVQATEEDEQRPSGNAGASGGARSHAPSCAIQDPGTLDCGVYAIVFALRWLVHSNGCRPPLTLRTTTVADVADKVVLDASSEFGLAQIINGKLWRKLLCLTHSACQQYDDSFSDSASSDSAGNNSEGESWWSAWAQKGYSLLDDSERTADEKMTAAELPRPLSGVTDASKAAVSIVASDILHGLEDMRTRLDEYEHHVVLMLQGRREMSKGLRQDLEEMERLLVYIGDAATEEKRRVVQGLLPALDVDMQHRVDALNAIQSISRSSRYRDTETLLDFMAQDMLRAKRQRRFWGWRLRELQRTEHIAPLLLQCVRRDLVSVRRVIRRYTDIIRGPARRLSAIGLLPPSGNVEDENQD